MEPQVLRDPLAHKALKDHGALREDMEIQGLLELRGQKVPPGL